MKVKLKGRPSIGIFGLAGVAFFGVCWLIAASGDPGWEFGVQMISTLGVSGLDSESIFNIGCICSGMLVLISGIGMTTVKKKAYFATSILVAIAGIGLTMIGLFPEDTGSIHSLIALILFSALLIGMIVGTIGDFMYKKPLFGIITILLLIIIVISALTQSFAFLEGVAAIAGVTWLALHSVKLSLMKF